MMQSEIHNAMEALKDVISSLGLEEFSKKYGIKTKTDGDHIILDYDMIDADWDFSGTHLCRGLVLDAHDLSPLCFPMIKFWNLGEHKAADVDFHNSHIFEKLDGTMMNRWWSPHTNRWEYTTRRQLPGDVRSNEIAISMTWYDLVEKCIPLPLQEQSKDETYTFEMMSPLNRVVVSHKEYKFGLLAIRNNKTYEEKSVFDHPWAPKTFDFSSHEEMVDFANELSGIEQEGFVVVDDNFNRVKVKGQQYVYLHALRGEGGAHTLKNIILAARKGDTEEIVTYFPELKEDVDLVVNSYNDIISKLEAAYLEIKDIESQKEFAINLNKRSLTGGSALFSLRSGKITAVHEYFDTMGDKSFVKLIRQVIGK